MTCAVCSAACARRAARWRAAATGFAMLALLNFGVACAFAAAWAAGVAR